MGNDSSEPTGQGGRLREVEKIVENRTAHYSAHSEAATYYTNTAAQVRFRFSTPIICRLTSGFKIMRVGDSNPFDFHVGDVMYVPQDTTIDVDLSTAAPDTPVECDCFEIETVRMQSVVARLNDSVSSRDDDLGVLMDWGRFVVVPKGEGDYLRLDHLMHLFRNRDALFGDALIENGIDEVILSLLQRHGRNLLMLNPDKAADNGINMAARLIRENLQLHLPNAELAKAACMSESTLQRQFLRRFGLSPARFAQSLRITKARHLLEQYGMSVEQISQDLGFSSTGHFTRIFRQFTGEPPASYRRKRLSPEMRMWEQRTRN